MPQPSIVSNIESPAPGPVRAAGVVLRGWAFPQNGGLLAGVRLRLSSGEVIAGLYGLPRPDVTAAFPDAHPNTGWELRTLLPSGRHSLQLEFQGASGVWVPAKEFTLEMRPSSLPRWSHWTDTVDLLMFQFPVHAAYPPRALRPERFPRPSIRPTQLPKLSIVTPSYQQAWALGRCMDSVIADRELTLEYFVQDGGSSDGSVAEIRLRAASLAGWSTGPDGGQSQAIATGFARTSGSPDDVMAWINSDDFYQPGALRFVAEYFARHPEVDVVYGHRIVVDRSGQEIARWYLPRHDGSVLRLNDFVPQETLFWRRRIWEQVGGINPAFHFAMDWDLLLRFQAGGARFARLPYFLACFSAHPEQKTTALLETNGKAEINALLRQTFGRDVVTPDELIASKQMQRYLRRSAWIEQLWKWGLRAR